ncbi:hypothetical protein ThidrDRAFT_3231 [Thiorhodococcus drewsii AZ1]|uniref:Uncharacterized protein n=1 Tax=Thiorhodococcus drewsii AZ1 TaxID=765913 RepID=G2E4L8_9GAMM|nr:hypothetical protein [Thiorhodococcus drewsii]EGV29639.1 hypothetical protein ThidrDRAFT_3231 [Thiorhodococcus drewsii AZ1]
MNASQNDLPSTASVLEALADAAETRQSKAGAFVYVHGHLIVECMQSGYCAAQIYRGLDDLGFHPPMSERQFRRYARQLKRHLGLVTNMSRHSRQRRLPAPDHSRDQETRSPNASSDPASSPPNGSGKQSTIVRPTTFDWDPTANIDDLS